MEINTVYPRWKVENPEETVKAWHFVLADYEAVKVKIAFKDYVRNDKHGYAPSAAQIISIINSKPNIDYDALAQELLGV